MSNIEQIDFSTLIWVKKELDETLNRAKSALEEYVENPEDENQLQFCATYLHQVQGTLKMVELYGAAMVAEEMEQVAKKILDGKVDSEKDAFEVLMRGIILLPDYLERVQLGYKDIPMVLLPLVNDLRTVKGDQLLSESALFNPNLTLGVPDSMKVSTFNFSRNQLRQVVNKIRTAFQACLLNWIKGINIEDSLKKLQIIIDKLKTVVNKEHEKQLFWVAGGLLEALINEGIDNSVTVKQLAARLDQSIRLITSKDNDIGQFRYLTKNLLYYVALSSSNSRRVEEIKNFFSLRDFISDERELEHAKSSMSGKNKELLESVTTIIRDDLMTIQEQLDLYIRNENAKSEDLKGIVTSLEKISDTLGILGIGIVRGEIQKDIEKLSECIENDSRLDNDSLMQIAQTLLKTESALDENIASLGNISQTGDGESKENEISGAEVKKIMDSLANESINNLKVIKKNFVAYIDSLWDRECVTDNPKLLKEISGALRMSGLTEVADEVDRISIFTQKHMLDSDINPTVEQLDLLAEAVASIEYYIEYLSNGTKGEGRILKLAQNNIKDLFELVKENEAAAAKAVELDSNLDTMSDDDFDMEGDMDMDDDMSQTEAELDLELDEFEEYDEDDLEGESNLDGQVRPELFVTFSEDTDADIKEVFVEEFEEELEHINDIFPKWRENPEENQELLGEIRRIYHTLKGSGRLVGALAIGEYSWKIEEMCNQVIEGSNDMNSSFEMVLAKSNALLPKLYEALTKSSSVPEGYFEIIECAQKVIDRKEVTASDFEVKIPLYSEEHVEVAVEEQKDIGDELNLEMELEQVEDDLNIEDLTVDEGAAPEAEEETDLNELFSEEIELDDLSESSVQDSEDEIELELSFDESIEEGPEVDSSIQDLETEFTEEISVETLESEEPKEDLGELEFESIDLSEFSDSHADESLASEESEEPDAVEVEMGEDQAESSEEKEELEDLEFDLSDFADLDQSDSNTQEEQNTEQESEAIESSESSESEEDLVFDLSDFTDEEAVSESAESDEDSDLEIELDLTDGEASDEEIADLNVSEEELSFDFDFSDDSEQVSSEEGELNLETVTDEDSSVMDDELSEDNLEDFFESQDSTKIEDETDIQRDEVELNLASDGIEIDLDTEGGEVDLNVDEDNIDFESEEVEDHELEVGETQESFRQKDTGSDDLSFDPVFVEIFHKEVAGHLDELDHYLNNVSVTGNSEVTDDFIRVVHTLNGAANMASVSSIVNMTNPLEILAKHFKDNNISFKDDSIEKVKLLKNESAEIMKDLESKSQSTEISNTVAKYFSNLLADYKSQPALDEEEFENEVDFEIEEATESTNADELEETSLEEHGFIGSEVEELSEDKSEEVSEDSVTEVSFDLKEESLLLPDDQTIEETQVDSRLLAELESDVQDSDFSLETEAEEFANEDLNFDVDEVSNQLDEDASNEETLESIDFSETESTDDITEQDEESVQEIAEESKELPSHISAMESESSSQAQVLHTDETEFDEELLEIFNEEATEILDRTEHILVELEENPDDISQIEALQRDLHTLKGGARMAGLNNIGNLGHAMESLLEKITEGEQKLTPHVLSVVHDSFDILNSMSNSDDYGQSQDIDPYVEKVTSLIGLKGDAALAEESKLDQSYLAPVEAMESDTGSDASDQSDGETVTVEKKSNVLSGNQIKVNSELLDNLVNYAGEVSIYRSRLEQEVGSFRFNLEELGNTVVRIREQLRKLDIETEAQIISTFQRETEEDESFDPLEMDRFSQLQQLSRSLSEAVSDLTSIHSYLDDVARKSDSLLAQQSRVNTELQEGLMETRLVSFNSIVPRLRRLVRSTSNELDKPVKLEVYGAEGEMDKTVLEGVIAPLEHMLRNSLAHGIEKDRHEAGKDAKGLIKLNVKREATEVVITVEDDGAGINRAKVHQLAVEKGLIKEGMRLSDENTDRLILHSGFSTADQVSKVAGRGVGMDVVNNQINLLGGALDIESTPHKGTKFHIRLPYTLALSNALLVEINETIFAVPVTGLEGIIRMNYDDYLNKIENDDFHYNYANEFYEMQDLGKILDMESEIIVENNQIPLVMIRSGDTGVALRVDRILGSREIVVKSVGSQISSVPGIFGATILGDGNVVLILDIIPLTRHYKQKLLDRSEEDLHVVEQEVEKDPIIMIVDDSITMRKVGERILRRNQYDVVTAKDGVDALEQLHDQVPDLMLLDIEMPRMDGYELAEEMKKIADYENIPIIMITSRTGEKHRQKAMDLGVNRYLGKPYQEADLLQNISELLEEYKG